ncbi:DHHC palmitoyltransferase-domain-containing protein [Mycena rosella]|uniref:Palmitoyltransferase n=1 Tax=Mycena rosella TaxID=1033263 RepID=A0AAD7MC73_MYCRO|nr:DHHC palmitoyltransferase-domain-containing protein [Mycena rosella]
MSGSPSLPDKLSPSQLPLPSTLTSVPPNSPPRHTRQGSTSTAGGPSSPSPMASPSKSPTMPSFASHYQHSSTHAGGIQPSASFFRPSRPNHQYRPPSTESALPTDGDVYNLSSLTKHISNDSDGPAGSVGGGTAEDEYTKQHPKPSREPLLPLGVRPSLSRPSLPRERSGSSSTGPLSPSRSATGRLVRNSLERVFSLRRGMSFESIRKSAGGAREGRMPFEDRNDEEHGMFDIPASSHYNTSTAPGDFPSSDVNHTPSASPEPSFAAPITNRDPPLSAMPVLDSVTHTPLRNHQLHPSRNRFFFNGRLLTGGDSPWAFVGSFTLLLTIAGVWFGTTCVWWWHNESPAVSIVGAYLALITLSSMLATATRDPGILPRNLDPDPPYPTTSPSDGGMRAPMPRDLKVRADVVRVKYCHTCKTYRPPRSSHCKLCDNCVDGCDHHCQWVNNCVGRRNYTTFFVLLFSATTTLILVICTSALHLFFLTRREGLDFKHALRRGAGSAVVFCLSIAVIWPVAALLAYHMRLLLLNVTTIEQIRNQAHKSLMPGPAPPNPFSHGSWRKNLLAVLCRPLSASWLDGAAFATQDEREVNPGLLRKERAG